MVTAGMPDTVQHLRRLFWRRIQFKVLVPRADDLLTVCKKVLCDGVPVFPGEDPIQLFAVPFLPS